MRARTATFVLIGAVMVAACEQEEAPGDSAELPAAEVEAPAPAMASGETLSAADEATIEQVRAIAASFTDIEAARAAGYTNQYPEGCVQSDAGAQGFHFLNDALLDGQVDLTTPELLMYEAQVDGSLQLVGVDYAIPFDQWTAAEPPQVMGRPMMRNEPLGVWAFHIWTHRDNPHGMFAAFNPAVNCDHASAYQPAAY